MDQIIIKENVYQIKLMYIEYKLKTVMLNDSLKGSQRDIYVSFRVLTAKL